jgi:ParB/RepB/Spo0J family partition protein
MAMTKPDDLIPSGLPVGQALEEASVPAEPTPGGEHDAPTGAAARPARPATGLAAEPKARTARKPQGKSKGRKKTTAPEVKPEFILKTIPRELLIITREDRAKVDEAGPEFGELVASVREFGILEPLVVRLDEASGKYRVIAGKRRLRAAAVVGLEELPCQELVSACSDMQEILMTLAENGNRKGNTPWEQANLFDLAVNEGLDKAAVAAKYGVSKSVVTEYLKLLRPEVKELLVTEEQYQKLRSGEISAKWVIRELDKRGQQPSGSAAAAGGPAAQQGPTPRRVISYPQRGYDDGVSGYSFKLKGAAETPPSAEELIDVLKRWLKDLQKEVKEAKKERPEGPPAGRQEAAGAAMGATTDAPNNNGTDNSHPQTERDHP